MLGSCVLYNDVNQLYIYIYAFPLEPPSCSRRAGASLLHRPAPGPGLGVASCCLGNTSHSAAEPWHPEKAPAPRNGERGSSGPARPSPELRASPPPPSSAETRVREHPRTGMAPDRPGPPRQPQLRAHLAASPAQALLVFCFFFN